MATDTVQSESVPANVVSAIDKQPTAVSQPLPMRNLDCRSSA
jgi:hypothetical protein